MKPYKCGDGKLNYRGGCKPAFKLHDFKANNLKLIREQSAPEGMCC